MKRWYEKPMRIGAVQWAQGEKMFDIPEILKDAGFNTEQLLHVVGDGVMGLFDEKRDRENLMKYIHESKKLGTRIILYFNAHMIEMETFRNKPQWAQRYKDGEAVRAYDTYILACVNSSWRDSLIGIVEKALDYGIDGVFLDGPIFTGTGCYCSECRKRFAEIYGDEIDRAKPDAMREFKTDSITRLVRDVKNAIDKKGTGTVLYVNSTGLAPNVTGCDIDGIYPYVDFIGTEGGFIFYNDPNRVPIWKCSQNAKYIEAKAKGKPTVIFVAANHSPWARCIHTPQETKLLFAATAANGANIWYGIHGPIDMLSTPGGKAAIESTRFLKKNEEFYEGTKACAEVALLWSKSTVHAFPEDVEKTDFTDKTDNRANYDYGNYTQEFKGFYDAAARNHTQFTIIDDSYIRENDISGFHTIILPNVLCLGEEECGRIRKFAEYGGTVIATFATSLFDEKGKKREKPLLADVFGIDDFGELLRYKPGCSYMETDGDRRICEGLSSGRTAGFMKSAKCKFSGSTKVIAWMYEPMEGSYAAFPTEKYPSVVISQYGKGRSIYISGAIGETYYNYGLNDIKRLMKNIISFSAQGRVHVENIFETVEVELREQPEKNRLLVHFVNFTGVMRRPIDHVIPCKDIKVSLKSGKKVDRIFTLYNKRELSFDVSDGTIRFNVPRVDEYEVAVVQFARQ